MGAAMPLEGRSLAIFTVSIVMMSFATTAASLRTFVRLNIVRAFGWDDALMVVASVLFIILGSFCIVGSMTGVGHTFTDFTSLDIYKKALVWWWLGQMLYVWTTAFTKLCIAVTLLRLTVKKSHIIILWCIIVTTVSMGLMFWLVLLFNCHPIAYFWHQVDGAIPGKCIPKGILLDVAYLYSVLSMLCDIALGTLPAFLVWKLQMNRRTKLAAGGILSLGAVASVATACRMPFLPNYADKNFLYSTSEIAICSIIEIGLGITAGSLITLRPLFRWLLDGSTTENENARERGRSSRQHPLSSFNSDGSKKSRDTRYWRPDIDPDDSKSVIFAVSPLGKRNFSLSSSQEALNSESGPAIMPNHVTVQQTFVQVVSEQQK